MAGKRNQGLQSQSLVARIDAAVTRHTAIYKEWKNEVYPSRSLDIEARKSRESASLVGHRENEEN